MLQARLDMSSFTPASSSNEVIGTSLMCISACGIQAQNILETFVESHITHVIHTHDNVISGKIVQGNPLLRGCKEIH